MKLIAFILAVLCCSLTFAETELERVQKEFMERYYARSNDDRKSLVYSLALQTEYMRDAYERALKEANSTDWGVPPHTPYYFVPKHRWGSKRLYIDNEAKSDRLEMRILNWGVPLMAWNLFYLDPAMPFPIHLGAGFTAIALLMPAAYEADLAYARYAGMTRQTLNEKLTHLEKQRRELQNNYAKIDALRTREEAKPWLEQIESTRGVFRFSSEQENQLLEHKQTFESTKASNCRVAFETLYFGPHTISGALMVTTGVAAASLPAARHPVVKDALNNAFQFLGIESSPRKTP